MQFLDLPRGYVCVSCALAWSRGCDLGWCPVHVFDINAAKGFYVHKYSVPDEEDHTKGQLL